MCFEERKTNKSACSFVAPTSLLVEEAEQTWTKIAPMVIDKRSYRQARRLEVGKQLLAHADPGTTLELMVHGQTTEFMTMQAALYEIEARFPENGEAKIKKKMEKKGEVEEDEEEENEEAGHPPTGEPLAPTLGHPLPTPWQAPRHRVRPTSC